jgi:hypothetical protein
MESFTSLTPPDDPLSPSNVLAPKSRVRLIPINAAGCRLDSFLRAPSEKERSAYKTHTKRKNLCSTLFLTGTCRHKKCQYDHSPITPSLLHVLRHRLREWPCHFKGACRNLNCFHGHVCVRRECVGSIDVGCRLGPEAHGVDLEVGAWVKPGRVRKTENKENEVRMPTAPHVGNAKTPMENWPAMGNLIDI